MPLLPALTLSAVQYKVSGGESKVSRRVDLPRNPHAPRSKFPKWPPSIFGGLLGTPVCVPMAEPPVSYLESTVPAAACEMAIVFGSARCAYFACRVLSI
jgi:hypothetical protein